MLNNSIRFCNKKSKARWILHYCLTTTPLIVGVLPLHDDRICLSSIKTNYQAKKWTITITWQCKRISFPIFIWNVAANWMGCLWSHRKATSLSMCVEINLNNYSISDYWQYLKLLLLALDFGNHEPGKLVVHLQKLKMMIKF